MADQSSSISNSNQPALYQIKIKGRLDSGWEPWFEGFTVAIAGDETVLSGIVADQAALFGMLKKVRDAGMTLISVNCTGPPQIG